MTDWIKTAHWNNPKQRKFGGFTKAENILIKNKINWLKNGIDLPIIVNLFCGSSTIGDYRVDINHESEFNVLKDSLEFLKEMEDNLFDMIICDPPYNEKNTKKYNLGKIPNYTGNAANLVSLKKEMIRTIKIGGFLIFKHWFDLAPGKRFVLEDQIVTKYGGLRRITIMTVYRKIQEELL